MRFFGNSKATAERAEFAEKKFLCVLRDLCGCFVLMVFGVTALAQSSTAPKKGGNPEAAKIKNPVAATPESISAGKKSYQRLCGKCHGPEGNGDGTAATGAQPPDLTDAQWDFGSSDGEMFSVIRDGTSKDMEGYKDRMSDAEMWNVVNYVKSLAAK
jgi:mono/diheme cytochrome c family protein